MSAENPNRRDFIKGAAAAGLGLALGGAAACSRTGRTSAMTGASKEMPFGFSAPPLETVRVGYVGVGGMGSGHVRNLLQIEGCVITAVCDIVPEKVERVQKWVTDAGFPKPKGYTAGDWDFKNLCAQEDVDLVYTATPWRWHVPVCLAAMENGKHAATEVPAAYTVDDCWALVETAESTQRHCVMMENCCYDRSELMVLHMVRKGIFGELMHGECGYMHDLRGLKFSSGGEGLWRIDHSIKRDGNLYPTHGLGPVAQCMNINRGDQFDFMVSMSTKARGLGEWAAEHIGKDSEQATRHYACGDVNSSLIRTKNGCTIVLQHDCNLPRPYSRINLVQGTKAIFRGYPDRIHIEGRSPGHSWEPADNYREEFEHPLWKNMQDRAAGAGHGGMDFIEDYRLIQCLRKGEPLDMDVYDAAAWSVVGPVSEMSVADKSRPKDVPDFTRGKWRWRPELGIIEG